MLANMRVRNGHGCMLQYALLHLFGYDVTLDDLKNFRVRRPKRGRERILLTPFSKSAASPPATPSPTRPPVSR